MSRVQAITCSTLISKLCGTHFPEHEPLFSVNEHVQSTGNHLQHTNQQNFVAHTFLSMNRYSLSMNMSRVQAITCSTLTSAELCGTHFPEHEPLFSVNEHVQCTGNHLQHTNQQNFVAHTFLSMNRYSLSMDMSRVQAITCSTLISRTLWHTLSWAWTIILCTMNMSRVQAITCSTLISRTLWHTLSWAWTVILCQWTCPEYRQSPAAH